MLAQDFSPVVCYKVLKIQEREKAREKQKYSFEKTDFSLTFVYLVIRLGRGFISHADSIYYDLVTVLAIKLFSENQPSQE